MDNSVFRVSSFPHLRLLHHVLKINIVFNRHDEATQFQQILIEIIFFKFILKEIYIFRHGHKSVTAYYVDCLALQVPSSNPGCCLG